MYLLYKDRMWHKAENGVVKKVDNFLIIPNFAKYICDAFVSYNGIGSVTGFYPIQPLIVKIFS